MCAPLIPLALTVASTAISAVGQMRAASYQAAIAKRNAEQADIMAKDAIARGEQKADSERRKTAYKIGAQTVGLAASGVDVGSGMALNIIGDTALLGEFDAQVIKDNAERESWGYKNQAEQFRMEAKAAKSQGLWNTLGTVVGGLTTASNNKQFPNFF